MITDDYIPMVTLGSQVIDAIKEMDSKKIGATIIVDNDKRLAGILTDGDLRRALILHDSIHSLKVEEIMSDSPRTIDEDMLAAEALGIMELYEITHLIILDKQKRVNGVIHLHDLLGRKDFKLNGGFIRH